MRVLISCSFARSLSNFRGPLLESIRARDHEIIALAPEFDTSTSEWCEERGIKTDTYSLESQGLNPIRDLAAIAGLVKIIRKHKPDVVMGYTHKPALYTALAAKIVGVPHITMMVTGLGFGFESGDRGWKAHIVPFVTTNLFRAACAACDIVIFHNRDNRDFFLEKRILRDSSKARVVGGSGVDLEHYQQLLFPPAERPDALAFLLIARIVRYKGILEYAQAAEQVRKNFPQARFLLAGYFDGNPLSYSKEEWVYIQSQLEYLGPLEDVRPAFEQAHVYVLPSYGEGMPRTVLEGMAHGRAVITTDTYGCRDTVDEGVNGFLVPIKTHAELAARMEDFLSGRADYCAMAQASLAKVQRDFAVEKVNADMRDALDLDTSVVTIGQ